MNFKKRVADIENYYAAQVGADVSTPEGIKARDAAIKAAKTGPQILGVSTKTVATVAITAAVTGGITSVAVAAAQKAKADALKKVTEAPMNILKDQVFKKPEDGHAEIQPAVQQIAAQNAEPLPAAQAAPAGSVDPITAFFNWIFGFFGR